jgi:hypothetical protein
MAQLQPYLRPGEQLLWSGRPDPDVRLTPADGFLIPFSILWTSFALFWEIGVATADNTSPIGAVFGIPFLAVGCYMVAGRFIYKRYRKQRTAYGITPQRALIAVGPGTLADVPLAGQPVTISRSRDLRHASVTFGSPQARPAARWPRSYGNTWLYANTGTELFMRSATLPFAFYDVAQPDAMLAALDQVRAGLG